MIRTRDFLLLLISVAFLMVLITAETAKQFFGNAQGDLPTANTPTFTEGELENVSAEVAISSGIDRQGNIERLREQLRDFIANPPEPETVLLAPPTAEVPEDTATTTELVAEIPTDALLCAGYASYGGDWPNQLLSINVQEGVRVVSIENASATSSATVVAVLPIRTLGSAVSPSCLPTDAVAIAQSGGLIRNNEAAGYLAFPEHVLIGYTLDGFSLYGYSERETDVCGGVMVDGEYRYYLSQNRESVLNCFAAPPVFLPS